MSDAHLLAIDIGNTNIVLGLWHWQTERWVYEWRARTVHDKTTDEYAVLVRNLLRDTDLGFESIRQVSIASVVPPLTSAFVELSRHYLKVEPVVVTSKSNLGIKIDVDYPEQVGADRIVNAAAVHYLYGGPAIVLDFGTATTYDVISREGNYIGGSIAPGIGILLDALVSRTAQLYKVTLSAPPSPIGRNTTHALQSGIFLGYMAMVEGLVKRIREAMPDQGHVKIIATGGLATTLKDHTDVFEQILPTLTLDGLRIIHGLNS